MVLTAENIQNIIPERPRTFKPSLFSASFWSNFIGPELWLSKIFDVIFQVLPRDMDNEISHSWICFETSSRMASRVPRNPSS